VCFARDLRRPVTEIADVKAAGRLRIRRLTRARPSRLKYHKGLVSLERDADAILIAPSHPTQPRGRYEHELIGKDASSGDREQRATWGDIHNGALALDQVTDRDLRANMYGLSRISAPLIADLPEVRPR
jgi:hypothetical protein